MSSESSTARWYEPPRSSLEPPSGGAGVTGVVGNPSDYRGYYPHAGPTAHHPAAAAAHYAHSKCPHSLFAFFAFSPPSLPPPTSPSRALFLHFLQSPLEELGSSSSSHFFSLYLRAICAPLPFHPRGSGRVGSRGFNDWLLDVSFEVTDRARDTVRGH